MESSCGKTSGFEEGDLSDSGKWLYHMLTGERGQASSNEKEAVEGDLSQSESEDVLTDGVIEIRAGIKNNWEAEGKQGRNRSETAC